MEQATQVDLLTAIRTAGQALTVAREAVWSLDEMVSKAKAAQTTAAEELTSLELKLHKALKTA